MFAKISLLCLLASVHYVNSAVAPFITKCKVDDAKCMKTSAQAVLPVFAAGIPSLNVDTLDPFFMKKLDASSPNLKLILKDINVTGLSQCLIKKAQLDAGKSKLYVKLQCTVDVLGQYQIDGNIIFLRIEGKGGAHVVLRKAVISAVADLAVVTGKDGLPHWSIKDFEHSYELKDKATIELENLFNGNEALGRAAKDLIASSPNEIIGEVGPPIIAAVVKVIADNVGRFLDNVPLEELVIQ